LGKLKNVPSFRRTRLVLILLVISMTVLEFSHEPHHVVFWWHKMPGFTAGMGFFGGFLLILFSKGLGRLGLQRRSEKD